MKTDENQDRTYESPYCEMHALGASDCVTMSGYDPQNGEKYQDDTGNW